MNPFEIIAQATQAIAANPSDSAAYSSVLLFFARCSSLTMPWQTLTFSSTRCIQMMLKYFSFVARYA